MLFSLLKKKIKVLPTQRTLSAACWRFSTVSGIKKKEAGDEMTAYTCYNVNDERKKKTFNITKNK